MGLSFKRQKEIKIKEFEGFCKIYHLSFEASGNIWFLLSVFTNISCFSLKELVPLLKKIMFCREHTEHQTYLYKNHTTCQQWKEIIFNILPVLIIGEMIKSWWLVTIALAELRSCGIYELSYTVFKQRSTEVLGGLEGFGVNFVVGFGDHGGIQEKVGLQDLEDVSQP